MAAVAVVSMLGYLVAAYVLRARARRARPAALTAHRGLAAYSPYFIWVPYAVAALRPGPDVALPEALRWIGLALVVSGPLVMTWSAVTLGRHFDMEIVVHGAHEVVSSGPYAVVRHPIYAGMALHFIGLAFATGNVVFILGTVAVSFPALYQRAAAEEALLRRELGPAYEAYARRVPMLIPRPGSPPDR